MRRLALGCFVALLSPFSLSAQTFTTAPCNGDNAEGNSGWFSGQHARACELRRATLPLVNAQVAVSGKNGSIEIVGDDRADVALEARVVAQASSRDAAAAMLREIRINTGPTIEASGPHPGSWSGDRWSVSYRLRVPRRLAAHLHTENGGIEVSGVDGAINADTTNGGLVLNNLAGVVHATTVNGGLEVTLAGNTWRGGGLFAQSTNGGVSVKAPDGYSAHLIAETTNGGISVAFPVTLHGAIRNHIDTDIGQGGATVELRTVNGGLSFDRL